MFAQPALRVLAKRHGTRGLGARGLPARFPAFGDRTPRRLVVRPLASCGMGPDRVPLERPDPLFVNVAGTAGEARRPQARAVAKDTARRLVLLARRAPGPLARHGLSVFGHLFLLERRSACRSFRPLRRYQAAALARLVHVTEQNFWRGCDAGKRVLH